MWIYVVLVPTMSIAEIILTLYMFAGWFLAEPVELARTAALVYGIGELLILLLMNSDRKSARKPENNRMSNIPESETARALNGNKKVLGITIVKTIINALLIFAIMFYLKTEADNSGFLGMIWATIKGMLALLGAIGMAFLDGTLAEDAAGSNDSEIVSALKYNGISIVLMIVILVLLVVVL